MSADFLIAAGYKLKLIMPANMSEERRAAMAAYGAELISVPAGKMELARDLAHEMQVLSMTPTRSAALSAEQKNLAIGSALLSLEQTKHLCTWSTGCQAQYRCPPVCLLVCVFPSRRDMHPSSLPLSFWHQQQWPGWVM